MTPYRAVVFDENKAGGMILGPLNFGQSHFRYFLAPPGRNLTFLHLEYAMKIRFGTSAPA
jgi:hypothetical protein